MRKRSPKQLIVVVVSLLVVTGMIPAVAVGAFTENATEPQEAISGNNFRDVSDDIEVWERAALPLRANPNVNADTSFRSVDLRTSVDELQLDNVPLDKDRTAVYDDSAEIQLEFESKTVASTSDFAGQDAQLMAVHIEEDTQAARDLFGSASTLTAAEALDLITEENANNNAHFDLQDTKLDESGETTVKYNLDTAPTGSGFYVFFLVQDHKGNNNWGITDKGFEETNGDISVVNKSRILGVDVATVHQQPATATPDRSRYNPGSDIYFDVDANQNSGQVTHAIAVYKRSGQTGFEGSDVTVEISGALNEDFSSDQVTVRREIKDVNGVAKVSGNPEIFGIGNLQDGEVSGLIAGSRIIDFVVEQANTDGPLDATTDNPKTLDASVRVIDGSDEASLTVETFENWSTGQYGYVYVATGADSSEITTKHGTININPSVTNSKGVNNNGRTDIEFPEGRADVSKIGITFGNDVSGNLRVEQRVSPSDGVPSIKRAKDREDPVYMDITVSGGADGSQATIEVTVKKNRLKGLADNKVSIWHYTGGKWVELKTKIVSQQGNTLTLRATTDSFSPFALAEATGTNEEVETTQPEREDDGPSVSSSSGGGGGLSLGSRTLYAITDFITGGSSADINVEGSSNVLVRVSMTFFDETAGQVRVEERNQPSLDENYNRNYDDTVLAVVDITPPNRVASEPGSITFEIRRSAVEALGVTASDLQVEQFDRENSTWDTLSTEVVEAEGNTVTIRTDVPSFGTYIISTVPDSASAGGSASDGTPASAQTPATDQSDADDDVQTMTGTATLRPGETVKPAETTSTEFPGLGISAALVAFVLALVLGWRRRQ